MQGLFKKYLINQCSPEEVNFLLEQFRMKGNKELLSKLITQHFDADQALTAVSEKEQETMLAETYSTIKSKIFRET